MDFEFTFRKYRGIANRKKEVERDIETPRLDVSLIRPINAPTGANLYKGKALAAEIEIYRRRVQTLLQFFELIAPHWWDRLHPFKNQLVKRPSRSADLLRNDMLRLSARLARLTPREVMPAAAAVVSIEERDAVPVLPSNLYRTATSRERSGLKFDSFESTEDILAIAYALSRRIGEIESIKQQLILHANDWITFDGRDTALRLRRQNTLAKHAKSCLIERFSGLQALITHYYRRRAESHSAQENSQSIDHEPSTDPKIQLKMAFKSITACRINSTHPSIMRLLENTSQGTEGDIMVGVGMLSDIQNEEMMDLVNRGNKVQEQIAYGRTINAESDKLATVDPAGVQSTSELFKQQSLKQVFNTIADHDPKEKQASLTFQWPSIGEASLLAGNLDLYDDLPQESDEANLLEERIAQRKRGTEAAKRQDINRTVAKLIARKGSKKLQFGAFSIFKEDSDLVANSRQPTTLALTEHNDEMDLVATQKNRSIKSRAIPLQSHRDATAKRHLFRSAGDVEDDQMVRVAFDDALSTKTRPKVKLAKARMRRVRSRALSSEANAGDRSGYSAGRSSSGGQIPATSDSNQLLHADFRNMRLKEEKTARRRSGRKLLPKSLAEQKIKS